MMGLGINGDIDQYHLDGAGIINGDIDQYQLDTAELRAAPPCTIQSLPEVIIKIVHRPTLHYFLLFFTTIHADFSIMRDCKNDFF